MGFFGSALGRTLFVLAFSILVAAPVQCDEDPGPGTPPVNPPTTPTTQTPTTPTTQTPTTQPPVTQPPVTQPPAIPAQCRAGFEGARVQIIGGTESPDGCRTYQVGLLERGSLICGGTLVADQWILTAAHCVTNGASISSLSIALGGQTLSNFDGEVIPVTNVIVHPQYNRNVLDFDVALMRLAAPANSDYTRALIPDSAVDTALASPGGSLLSSGWGVFQSNGQSSSDELLEVLMPISQTVGCTPQPATGREICSGGIGQSTCYGDSGGPLAGIFNDEIYVLGIVSYGDSGCRFFSVYARVASFQGWINNTMASNG